LDRNAKFVEAPYDEPLARSDRDFLSTSQPDRLSLVVRGIA
jgi:hypothetical protein